jgi:UDP-hydrolysing UDP-N-acetyl-D-glucosamine 2-epimerase
MADSTALRRVAVITGSRADFGLLVPVIRTLFRHPALEPLVIAAGTHLIAPALTFRDVKALFPVADSIPMQTAGHTGRAADVQALAKGIARFGRSFESLAPHWVLVLGDRIEAFAAAAAASVGGLALAHIHGGDRAEGVADEAMRHAVSKLAHLHLAASQQSAERLIRMGEKPHHIVVTGSPAIDDLDAVAPLEDRLWADLGSPSAVLLLHPVGRDEAHEYSAMLAALSALSQESLLVLHPNHDPGREGIIRAMRDAAPPAATAEHLPRPIFLSLLKRLAVEQGVFVGNSSAGLIEAAALGVRVVNIGPRQQGRERPHNVLDVPREEAPAIAAAVQRARATPLSHEPHPFGSGCAAPAIADALAAFDPADPALLRKLNTY